MTGVVDTLRRVHAGRPLPGCPGRYVLRAVEPTVGPRELVGRDATITEHDVDTARDRVVVTWLDDGGLISYARPDGRWLHTVNTPDGFGRKLAALGIVGPGATLS